MSYKVINFQKNRDEKYIPDIVALSDAVLSSGFLKSEETERFGNEDRFCTFVIDENDSVCGVSFGRFIDIGETARFMMTDEKEISELFPEVKLFAEHSGIAVREDERGKGVGKLLHSQYKSTVFNKADVILYGVWNRGGGEEPSVNQLNKSGAHFIKTVEKYWYDHPDLYCDICKGRCRCSCDFYYIKKDGYLL